MKLGICSNYSHPSIGGSESVLKNISELLLKIYNYDINIYSFNVKSCFCENGVKYFPCEKGDKFISQISQNDHIFVYSDSFWEFPSIIDNLKELGSRATVALVGAYHTISHSDILSLLKKMAQKINLITHSSITPDYKFCMDHKLPVWIIPNGINLDEFNNNNFINFREKYNIKEKYIIISISNFFYGKGNEVLPDIYDRLSEKLDDFVIVQISSTVDYPYDKIFLEQCKKKSRGRNIKFLRDIPREDVVAAFKCSDIFLFCSKKEVSPLVILESRAAKIPWVSLKVGNIEEQKGGITIDYNRVDEKGYVMIDDNIIKYYCLAIIKLIQSNSFRGQIINEGQKDIEFMDWKHIVHLYHEVFSQ